MNNRIVIFGATGNLGAYAAIELKKEGNEIFAVGSRSSDNGFFNDYDIPYFSVDITNKDSFRNLPEKDVDAVIHFAGSLPSRYEYDPKQLIDSIVGGTMNVLEYMRCCGAKKIVFPQTPFDIYYLHNTDKIIEADATRSFPKTGDHSVYTIAKNAAVDLIEHYYHTFGISRFILRFFTIYQYHPNSFHYANYDKRKMPYRILIDKALNSEDIEVWGDPSRSKEIVYIKDFIQVVSKCINSKLPGGMYNVGNDKAISLEEQIQGIIDIFSPSENPSKKIYRPKMPNSLLAKFDITKTKKELGYEPAYSYIEAMKDFYKEMKEEPYAKLWGKKEDYL